MKKFINLLPLILLMVFSFGILTIFVGNKIKLRKLKTQDSALIDSLSKIKDEKFYMTQLINVGLNGNKKLPRNLKAHDMSEPKHFIDLDSLLSVGKKKLVVRYTEIGCNSCTDSTFKLIKNTKGLRDNFETIVLVDFSNYEYYVKWKKITEVTDKVLWIKKGDLPFKIEKENYSYLFIVDNELNASAFFIPNSRHTSYLSNYFRSL